MYRLHAPAPDLADAIDEYWSVDPAGGPVDLTVDAFVDGRADLVFNFGASYTREVIGGAAVEHVRSNLDAQRVVPIRIRQRGEVRIYGVRFRLGGLAPFVDRPLRPFTNQTPPPEDVFGPGAVALEGALGAAGSLDAAASELDRFFRARRVDDPHRRLVQRAIDLLSTVGASVDGVAGSLGVSGRQLDRLFARHVGIPPKTIARIQRFQRALRALMRDPGCPLADVALRAGYFDQAHFIRDFRAMTGGVPRGYRGYYPPDAPTHFAPNVVVFVQAPARVS